MHLVRGERGHPPGCWEELHRGQSPELILAIGRPLLGPPGTDLRPVAALLDTEHTVWQALGPPPGHRPRGLDLHRCLTPWLEGVTAGGLRVRAVLGLGPGALYAELIAAGVARRQRTAPVVLLPEPAAAVSESIPEQCRRLVARVSGPRRPPASGPLRSTAGLTQDVLNLTASRLPIRTEHRLPLI
ncbi:hypothetical protein [Streptomyces sp. NPDC056632]|uniref:hypothetical protein n=1 Tax=Streptomyces sp. NPDC056632 TaxID=3345884 RepID=UPI0036BA639B